MARGYSNDLRERVVAIVEDGESAREAARLLNIGASTAIRWIERWTKTGSVAAKPGTGHTRSPLKQHQQWLLALVAGEPDLTLHACEQPFDKALGHPDAMKQKWQVDIDQRIGSREPLPRESLTAKAIDDPLLLTQQIGVRLQELVLGYFDASRFELHHVHDVKW